MTDNFVFPLFTMALMGLGASCLYFRRELQTALIDPTYGILTRVGGERAWQRLSRHYTRFEVVFLDLDELHRLNIELGYAEVDRRIRAALVHRNEDIMTARWYSGDEIVAIVPRGDGSGFAHRLLDRLRNQGLSATFGVVPASPKLADAVWKAMELVTAAKTAGQRGIICGGEARQDHSRPTTRTQDKHRAVAVPTAAHS
jgi:GGDEF domain-containing protein